MMMATKSITVSGYSKIEAYSDLLQSMKKKDFTKVCLLMTELACTKGEYINLCSFLIETFSKHYVSGNILVLNAIVDRLRKLLILPKRNLIHNSIFQSSICECFMLVATQKPKNISYLLNNVGFDSIETIIYNVSNKKYKELAPLYENDFMTSDMVKMINSLYHRMRHRDKNMVQVILSFILCHKTIHISPIPESMLKCHVKDNFRSDIVWYLWWLLFVYCGNRLNDETMKQYISGMCWLYCFQYQKKHRLQRINLLMKCFLVVSEKKQLCEKDLDEEVIKAASSKICVAFIDVIEKNGLLCANNQRKEKKQQNLQNMDEPNRSYDVHDSDEVVDLSYLKYYTYIDEDLQREIESEKMKKRAEIAAWENSNQLSV